MFGAHALEIVMVFFKTQCHDEDLVWLTGAWSGVDSLLNMACSLLR